MDNDEIIYMAQEAGYPYGERGDGTFKLLSSEKDIVGILERFAALVAAHEREACAKVCEEIMKQGEDFGYECAAAIRARGEK